jgi:hypothetical protein
MHAAYFGSSLAERRLFAFTSDPPAVTGATDLPPPYRERLHYAREPALMTFKIVSRFSKQFRIVEE